MASQRDFTYRKPWINVLLRLLQLLLPYIQHGGAQFQALTRMSSVVEVWQAEDADFFISSQAEEQHSENVPRDESAWKTKPPEDTSFLFTLHLHSCDWHDLRSTCIVLLTTFQ
ncbi:transmembrane protein 131-like [Sinocyclocheilus grahami]|uniref:transmembrane protein 131-like n=1 Tax=Sinocyclocheilus grahami TaxID=75366 RepID=UPI0007AC65C8|nr:PREDICTED: transmembrane protein 131-like [Sinocyclocheilus grahami]